MSHIATKPHILRTKFINGGATPILGTCSHCIMKVHEIKSMEGLAPDLGMDGEALVQNRQINYDKKQ